MPAARGLPAHSSELSPTITPTTTAAVIIRRISVTAMSTTAIPTPTTSAAITRDMASAAWSPSAARCWHHPVVRGGLADDFDALGWLLIASSVAISALLFVPPIELAETWETQRSWSGRGETRSPPRLRSSGSWFGQDLRGPAGTLIAPAAVFLLIAGIGTAMSYVVVPPERDRLRGQRLSDAQSPSGADGEHACPRGLRAFDWSRRTSAQASAAGTLLPDVNTMIERLAARLETSAGRRPRLADAWLVLLQHGALREGSRRLCESGRA